ncbi:MULTISPECIES: hypothetical protein [Thalassospira]|uniref:Uncharacterized protein n=1 Tax=Thalassospira aquimaris TaxID=3037796 RepID=A0ABT6G875_9PROT|nr:MULTISPECIES: hypothetical protein [Thalassospira]MDG4718265.1 hypothetical protein [Thalassospira sp. FZY0004]
MQCIDLGLNIAIRPGNKGCPHCRPHLSSKARLFTDMVAEEYAEAEF